jgi:carbonic anhydrase
MTIPVNYKKVLLFCLTVIIVIKHTNCGWLRGLYLGMTIKEIQANAKKKYNKTKRTRKQIDKKKLSKEAFVIAYVAYDKKKSLYSVRPKTK